jgi:single-stranded-DNA-specific exonuclease
MQQKNWVYKEVDEVEVEKLIQSTGVARALAKVFVSRGMLDGGQVKRFMKPDIGSMTDPFCMDGMAAAADRILCAISASEEMLIYGDYDVDGVAGTSILYNFLKSRDAHVQYFIPDRMEDGYGLTFSSVEKVKKLKASLLVTVDCGISSVDEVRSLNDFGMQVIVTDHHECRDLLPEAIAVLNPHKPGCGYPFKELAGAGVALKLVQALCIKIGCADEFVKYIDLAALATIADMVPLQGENRIIASCGLKAMETTRNIGLGALIRTAGFGDKPMSSYSVAFGLAPRVNAAGRLGSADRSVRLFTTEDLALAEVLAKELDSENKSRQETESEILNEAIAFVQQRLDPVREKVLVVSGEGWHHGVIGIVASKVLEKYNRPCIVISVEDGVGKGSGRSIAGLNLFKALTSCENLLERFGGHEMAAGLTIRTDKIDEFRTGINKYADEVLTETDLLPCVRVDAFIGSADISMDSARELTKMAPFGCGNVGPVFGYTAIRIEDIKTLSAGKHLKLRLSDCNPEISGRNPEISGRNPEISGRNPEISGCNPESSGCNPEILGRNPELSGRNSEISGRNSELSSRNPGLTIRKLDIEAIGFNMGEQAEAYEAGDVIDAIFTLEINSWNGSERLQLNLKDIKTCIFMALDKNIVFSMSNDYNRYNNSLKKFYSLQGYCRLKVSELVPERNELEAVFRYIRACCREVNNGGNDIKQRMEIADLFAISTLLSQKHNISMNYFKLKKSLEIFGELGLLTIEPVGHKGTAVCLTAGNKKVELEASDLFLKLQSLKQEAV